MENLLKQMTKIIKRKLTHTKSAKKYYYNNREKILSKVNDKRHEDMEGYNKRQRGYYHNKHEENKEKNRIAMRKWRAKQVKNEIHTTKSRSSKRECKRKTNNPPTKIVPQQKRGEKVVVKFFDDGIELTDDEE
jgi:hypothetical protein